MVEEIKVINAETLESVVISKYSRPFILDSIDWDSPTISPESYRVPFQIGETFSGVTVGLRSPTVTGYIVSENLSINKFNTWQEYYDKQLESIEDTKKKLNRIISIYQDIIIQAGEYYLKAKPAQPVKYSNSESENNEVMCMFSIDINCYNPMFYKDTKHIVLATIENKFHFPLVLTEQEDDEHVVFGSTLKRQAIEINNTGDVPVGGIIEIKVLNGEVNTLNIYNINKNEGIVFYSLEMEAGDTLLINTNIGEESAVHHSLSSQTDKSIVSNIKKGSKFIQIEKGTSFYAYQVNESEENNIEMSIDFTEQFFNMEKM